ncbi:hypothetical protein NDA11_001877 [Ustilago hordei]|uniref:SRR1-like domain-containing protein n=1 Tax=Ustilago hordei TaxID=120017 RepID=I2FUK3_USTHO|nr:uncharacterized protein UHO2_05032 [Ustilago hordei]KAJ1043321.1 hypothetical protein NDA10_004255 [Ustilago hordei]KAJ1572950.1 hypothetical protein NDA12_001011 [Ustilago hordei]KAJ1577472.1 hypothetical protein NDA11_001877 [Ustilago hordei]KAJ1582123.1 hypothetical protein NDA15_003089 [Ustilago hordei]KAJ1597935.1 hypothetical protein NDA14_007759 [Ustilago hordei]
MSDRAEEEEAPFVLVKPKRRQFRPTQPANPAACGSRSCSSSNGSISTTCSSSGFSYSRHPQRSARRNRTAACASHRVNDVEQEERTIKRAFEVIDVFVAYLSSALSEERSDADRQGRRSYAQLLASTFASVWSDHKAEGKAEVPKKIVCLGLGSPTSSRSAQVQLALLVVVRTYISLLPSSERDGDTEAVTLTSDPDNKASVKGERKQTQTSNGAAVLNGERRERLHGEKGAVVDCVAYDPVFTSADIKLLARYGVRALAPYSTPPSDSRSDPTTSNPSVTPATNASASSIPSQAEKTVNQGTAVEEETIDWHYTRIRTPTLVYMPHCDRELYEHILSLNYPPSSTAIAAASPTVLLSNILKNYTTFNSHLGETWPTLHRLIPQLRIVEVPNWQSGKPSALIPQEAQEQGGGKDERRRERGLEVVGEFVKMWDKNALRDLGFHWL